MAKDILETKIDKLAKTVEKGFAIMHQQFGGVDRGFAAVAEDIGDLRKDMASGFLRIEERLFSIEQELKDIKHRLSALEKSSDAMASHSDDIRELRVRVKNIEKYLKIKMPPEPKNLRFPRL